MTFALRRRRVTGAPHLAAYFDGATLELAEANCGMCNDLGARFHADAVQYRQALFGASLLVDGEPIGYEALRALPGRLLPELARLMAEASTLYESDDTGEPRASAGNDEAAPEDDDAGEPATRRA